MLGARVKTDDITAEKPVNPRLADGSDIVSIALRAICLAAVVTPIPNSWLL
jgi:hypothetical protein